MSSKQRIVVCLIAGILALIIMAIAGLKPSGVIIGSAIGLTAIITQNFRNDTD